MVVVVVGGAVVGGDVVVVAMLPLGPDRTSAGDDVPRAALLLLGPFVEHDARTATTVIAARPNRWPLRLWPSSDLLTTAVAEVSSPYPFLRFGTDQRYVPDQSRTDPPLTADRRTSA